MQPCLRADTISAEFLPMRLTRFGLTFRLASWLLSPSWRQPLQNSSPSTIRKWLSCEAAQAGISEGYLYAHTIPPFWWYPVWGLGSYKRKVGYPIKGYGMSLQVACSPSSREARSYPSPGPYRLTVQSAVFVRHLGYRFKHCPRLAT